MRAGWARSTKKNGAWAFLRCKFQLGLCVYTSNWDMQLTIILIPPVGAITAINGLQVGSPSSSVESKFTAPRFEQHKNRGVGR